MPDSTGENATEVEQTQVLDIGVLLALARQSTRLLATWTAGGAIVFLALSLLAPDRYTATASFLPQSQSDASQSGLRALAGQFGINVGGATSQQSPDLYAELLVQSAFLKRVAAAIQAADEQTEQNLLSVLRVDTADVPPGGVPEAIARRLGKALSVSVSRKSGVVLLNVKTRDREVSLALLKRLLDEVNEFNVESRSTQAGSERAFAEERLVAALTELRSSEDRLSGFLERNRAMSASPSLLFERGRLERDVALRQQIVVTLSQSLEEARLREVRDTPLIAIVGSPDVSYLPDRRYTILVVIVGAVLSLGLGVLHAITRALRVART